MKGKKVRAFTLLEMVIVVIIIMILASLIVLSLGGVRKRARDDRRMADAQTIASALSQYATSNTRYYPPYSSSHLPPNENVYVAEVIQSGSPIFSILSGYHKKIASVPMPFNWYMSSYLNPVPVDPLNGTGNYRYVYIHKDNGREAAIVVDKFEYSGRCNIPGNSNLPTGVQQYVNRQLDVQPPAGDINVPCYYVAR